MVELVLVGWRVAAVVIVFAPVVEGTVATVGLGVVGIRSPNTMTKLVSR